MPLAIAACFFETESRLTPRGTVTLSWTVDGRVDAGACAEQSAVYAHVNVLQADDTVADDELLACTAFAAHLSLREGHYRAIVALERDDRTRVGTGQVIDFSVRAGDDTPLRLELATVTAPRAVQTWYGPLSLPSSYAASGGSR